MKKRGFRPEEILFSPTLQCNLDCAHCDVEKSSDTLSVKSATVFLKKCAKAGISRLGFTGGEPFLVPDFLVAVSKEALRQKMFFSRIATNGVWFENKAILTDVLTRLFRAGYDGDILLSVDAFHKQELRKVAMFIRTVSRIWNRPEMVSIAAVKGSREAETLRRLRRLAAILKARLCGVGSAHSYIKREDLLMRIIYIDLSPIGRAAHLKNPWDGKWFKDDFCRGPGNIFFVTPDGKVAPCCGYANNHKLLNIGTINDLPEKLIKNAQKNKFVSTVFSRGLHAIRKRLTAKGIRFPGKTINHCFFCSYLLDLV
jgi:MoaA/NifB/PqqE/SkfB family radical SAM enzyme